MPYYDFLWTPERTRKSSSSGNPVAWGYTQDGRYIIVVYQKIDPATVLPVTAYEVPESRK